LDFPGGHAGKAALIQSNPESIDEMERPSSRISMDFDLKSFNLIIFGVSGLAFLAV
jgi:hypothetical protein